MATVFVKLSDSGETEIKSVVIVVGDRLSYAINGVTSMFEIFYNLFAVYYCLDLHYPARYRILNLLDKLCLENNGEAQPRVQLKKRKRTRKHAADDENELFASFQAKFVDYVTKKTCE